MGRTDPDKQNAVTMSLERWLRIEIPDKLKEMRDNPSIGTQAAGVLAELEMRHQAGRGKG